MWGFVTCFELGKTNLVCVILWRVLNWGKGTWKVWLVPWGRRDTEPQQLIYNYCHALPTTCIALSVPLLSSKRKRTIMVWFSLSTCNAYLFIVAIQNQRPKMVLPAIAGVVTCVCVCVCVCCCSLLCSVLLRSRTVSLLSYANLREWIAFHSAFLNIHRSGVITALTCLVPHETAAVSARSVYTIQPCTMSLHAKPHT